MTLGTATTKPQWAGGWGEVLCLKGGFDGKLERR
jgi:hypothetical protein